MSTIPILDIPIHTLDRREAVERFLSFTKDDKPHFCATPNAEILLKAQQDPILKKALQNASLNTPDSVSLLWAGQCINGQYSIFRGVLELLLLPIRKTFWTQTFPEVVSGSDLYLDICEAAAEQNRSVFLLGGQGAVPQANAENLQTRFPRLNIAGYHEGNPNKKFDQEIIRMINQSSADILFVAFGCPAQEYWLTRNLDQLTTIKAGIGLGGSFDFVAGHLPRSPKVIRKLGLEWLWRLLCQPTRWKRILKAVIIFPYRFLKAG